MFDLNKIREIESIEPTEEELAICSACRGECCRRCGCAYIPTDFEEISFEYLKSKIDEGYISIDWYEGLEYKDSILKGFFLRVRNVDSPIVDPSWGGICSKLTKNGCSFSYKDRPFGGKDLKPTRDNGCSIEISTKMNLALMWLDYYDILEKLYDTYYDDSSDTLSEDYIMNFLNTISHFLDVDLDDDLINAK